MIKGFQKILNLLRCDMVTSLIDMRPACADVQLLVFYLFHEAVQVCEIKNYGNPDLVCKNVPSLTLTHSVLLYTFLQFQC